MKTRKFFLFVEDTREFLGPKCFMVYSGTVFRANKVAASLNQNTEVMIATKNWTAGPIVEMTSSGPNVTEKN